MDDFSTGIEIVQAFIDPKVYIVVPVLWFLGVLLKTTPKFPDWAIVWVLVVIGILLSLAFIGLDVYGLVQGILATATATLGYDLFKQTMKSVDSKKTKGKK